MNDSPEKNEDLFVDFNVDNSWSHLTFEDAFELPVLGDGKFATTEGTEGGFAYMETFQQQQQLPSFPVSSLESPGKSPRTSRRESLKGRPRANGNLFDIMNQRKDMAQMAVAAALSPVIAPMMHQEAAVISPSLLNSNAAQGNSGAENPYAWMSEGAPRLMYDPTGTAAAIATHMTPLLYNNPYMNPALMAMGAGMFNPMAGSSMLYAHRNPKMPVQPLKTDRKERPSFESQPPLILPCFEEQNAAQLYDKLAVKEPISEEQANKNLVSLAPAELGLGDSPPSEEWVCNMRQAMKLFLEDALKIDYSNVTVNELKTLLRKYQLTATGKKAVLEERIKAAVVKFKNMGIAPEVFEKFQHTGTFSEEVDERKYTECFK